MERRERVGRREREPFGCCLQEGGRLIELVEEYEREDHQILLKILKAKRKMREMKAVLPTNNQHKTTIQLKKREREDGNHDLKMLKIVFQEKQLHFQQGFSSPYYYLRVSLLAMKVGIEKGEKKEPGICQGEGWTKE